MEILKSIIHSDSESTTATANSHNRTDNTSSANRKSKSFPSTKVSIFKYDTIVCQSPSDDNKLFLHCRNFCLQIIQSVLVMLPYTVSVLLFCLRFCPFPFPSFNIQCSTPNIIIIIRGSSQATTSESSVNVHTVHGKAKRLSQVCVHVTHNIYAKL